MKIQQICKNHFLISTGAFSVRVLRTKPGIWFSSIFWSATWQLAIQKS